ncbi:MAG: AzlD domain-containing protein [Actinomycetota bacterium]|nr:AzlD domain-containing protein [Actinomycetota bacterium]
MSPLHDWPYLVAAIAGLTVITVATRTSFFLLPARFTLPAGIERALRYAPACALAAIVAQGVFAPEQRPFISWYNNQMWALLAGSLVFAKTRNMVATITVGMAVFTVLRLWA